MKVGKGDDSFLREKKEDGKSERKSKMKSTDIKSLLKPNYPKLTQLSLTAFIVKQLWKH